jgi:hypothetical protein
MGAAVPLVIVLALLASSGCITRPGMNRDCRWPSESPIHLDLSSTNNRRHLVIDAELIEELVDRYRFHPGGDQEECRSRLTDAVARLHGVSATDVLKARERVAERGLNLPVNVPVALLFLFTVLRVRKVIERRFEDEPLPAAITLILASLVLSGLLVVAGEFWTSILEMIRVGSQHVGGRVAQLQWRRHEREIFLIALCAFWAVVLGQSVLERRIRACSSTVTRRSREAMR